MALHLSTRMVVAGLSAVLAAPTAEAAVAPSPAGRILAHHVACAPAPEPLIALANQTSYQTGDATFSKVDDAREAIRRAQIAPLVDLTRRTATYANRYVRSQGRDTASGACVLRWLDQWARADAMQRMLTHDAQFVRAVNLSGWALAYAQVARLEIAGDDPRPRILAWFARMADDLRRHHDGLTNTTARNNHRYWAGLAAMAVGRVTQDRGLRDWALASARIGLAQVNAEGALPLELARGERARHYHLYAATPLVMTAELALIDRVDLYRDHGGALRRLVRFATGSIGDPSRMASLSGAKQLPFVDPRGAFFGQMVAWYEYYGRRFAGEPGGGAILTHRPLVNAEIGGDITLLASQTTATPRP